MARQRYALALGGLVSALLASAPITPLAAQRGVSNAPRILVPTLRAKEAGLGVEAAEAVRERLGRDFTPRTLWVISKNDIVNTLTASGYNPDSSLGMTDLRQLAQMLRADEIVDGTITRAGGNYRLEARYMVPRGDQMLVQPLPAIESGRVDGLANRLSDAVKSSRRQLEGYNRCLTRAREGKHAEAAQAAREGIGAYPNSTIARLCLATVYNEMNQPDSVLRVAEEVLAIDPRNRMALEFAAEGYVRTQQEDKAVDACANLIGVAPTDTRIVERCIGVIVSSGAATRAVPILERSVAESPADPTLRRLQWRVLLLTKNWEQAVGAGEELVRLDTAQADTAFFLGQATAFQNDSNFVRATEVAARGYQKFPGNPTLALLYVQMLRGQGQLAQALDVLNRELATNPRLQRGYVQKQQIFAEFSEAQYQAGQADSARAYADSAVAALQAASANGEDSTLVAQLALQAGNTWYKRASGAEGNAKAADARQAVRFLALSNQLAPTQEAQFLLGASHFTVGQVAYGEARERKTCAAARTANEAFTQAQIYIPQGGAKFPDAAAQLMGYVTQLVPVTERMVSSYCK